jgi:uncharacterized peroxidase-related enzyme
MRGDDHAMLGSNRNDGRSVRNAASEHHRGGKKAACVEQRSHRHRATLPRCSGEGQGQDSLRFAIALYLVHHASAPIHQRVNAIVNAPVISRYPVPRLEDLPEDIRARMLEVQEKAGFIPNVFLTLAHRPAEFRAFFDYHDALMLKEGGLSKAEREMIVVATSGANDCLYCIVAHGAILRVYAKNPLVADQVAVNYRKADITPRQKAMLAFALKVAQKSVEIVDDDFTALRAHGFSDEDIWDIGAIAAFFALSNRMANLIAMRPNDEFHVLGRLPRKAQS